MHSSSLSLYPPPPLFLLLLLSIYILHDMYFLFFSIFLMTLNLRLYLPWVMEHLLSACCMAVSSLHEDISLFQLLCSTKTSLLHDIFSNYILHDIFSNYILHGIISFYKLYYIWHNYYLNSWVWFSEISLQIICAWQTNNWYYYN